MKFNEVVLFLLMTVVISTGIIQNSFSTILLGLLLLIMLVVLVQIHKKEEDDKEKEKIQKAIKKSKRPIMRIKK